MNSNYKFLNACSYMGSAEAVRLGTKSRGTSLSIFMTIGGFAGALPPLIVLPIVKNYGLSSLTYFMTPGLIIAGGIGGLGILLYGKMDDIYGLLNTTGLFVIPLVILNILILFLPVKKEKVDL